MIHQATLYSFTLIFKQEMELKKTTSAIHRSDHVDQIKLEVEMASPPPEIRSEDALRSLFRTRQRVPGVLQSTLREKNSEKKSARAEESEKDIKKSKVGSVILSGIRTAVSKVKDITFCEICEAEIKKPKDKNKEVYMCECEHRDKFCQSCLHHYVIYKVKTFEEVYCPREGCPQLLDMNTSFFKSLPIDIQKNYKKLHQFYVTSKDPNSQLCPKEDCEGIIRRTTENVMVCDLCNRSFCAKCLLDAHADECDTHEVKFFEDNLHYRRCDKCKFIVQKDQGCNHITCRCGYNFCYVCGKSWTSAHYGVHDANGNVVEGAAEPAPFQGGQACCDCTCMDEICCQPLAFLCKLPIKLILLVLFVPMMLLLFVSRDLLVFVGMFIVTIFAGLFGFSFEILSELECPGLLLGIVFFPVVMIIGVGRAFQEIFLDVVPEIGRGFCQIFCNGLQSIGNI